MRDYRKLRAFELADALALLVYEVTCKFPREEMFTMTSQMRRAALSIPSNIVEGSSRSSHGEYLRFLDIAYGSVCELEMSLARRLGYLKDTEKVDELIQETAKVLNGLIRSLRKTSGPLE